MFGLLDTCSLALERLWQHRMLALWVLLGLCAATTLALSLALFVDAVNTNLLSSRLGEPPYAFRYRYLGSWEGNIAQPAVERTTAVIESEFTTRIALPVANSVRYVSGGRWTVRVEDGANLGALSLGTLQGAEGQITIVAGEWTSNAATEDDTIPVLLPETMLYTMGVQVGDILIAQRGGAEPVQMRVTALWRAANEDDPTWIFPPKYFDTVALMDEERLWRLIEPLENPVEESAWQIIFDGRSMNTAGVNNLLARIDDGQRLVTNTLPGIRLELSPVDNLRLFQVEVSLLTQQLVIILLPVAGLVLYFVALVAGLLVKRQLSEDVTLRSRGMSRLKMIGLHVLMWLMLVGAAFAVGMAAAAGVVQLVGQTTSFLRFDGQNPPLQLVFTPQIIAAGLLTGLIAASSGLIMAAGTSRQTITSFRQSEARSGSAWWQRLYLDVMLLVPALYVLFTLWQQGGIRAQAENPFADPLTFLAPTLFSLGLTFFFLRLLPVVLRLLAGLMQYTSSIAALMALRELTRSAGRYRGTLLMMGFTLSLMGFTASMASTLDRSLEDTIDYRVGADTVLVTAVDAQTERSVTGDDDQQNIEVTGFNVLPPDELMRVDGVRSVSRVGRFPARVVIGSQRIDGTLLGIDRAAIASVTRARMDYASEPFADVFNRLAGNRNGLILNQQFATERNLQVGQQVRVQVNALNEWYETTVPIVGLVSYFPTLDPMQGFFGLTNLDPVFELVGTALPHDYWLGLTPDADRDSVLRAVRTAGYPVLEWRSPEAQLEAAKASPLRRGVLGFLSVGFIASIVLTVISAIVQSTSSFRAQSAQLGSLRAMGLGGGQVAFYLMLLQGMVVGMGILSGTLIGLLTTQLYLPLLDFSDGLPPYFVRIAWNDITLVYGGIAFMLLIVTFSATLMISRERLTTVVKLGDA
jgi:putative ABC transport system permease protein